MSVNKNSNHNRANTLAIRMGVFVMNDHFLYRAHCALCGSSRKNILISKDFTDPLVYGFIDQYYEGRVAKAILDGATYEVAKCFDCGFLWQTYILNDRMMTRLYDEWICPEESLSKKRCADISLYTRYANEARRISSVISRRPCEISVLDFGMGWGFWCLMAKAFGFNVYGFETSRERLEYAAKNGITVINEFSSLQEHGFDFINAEQVFEHLPNPVNTLRELANTLDNGGVIRIAVPDGENIEQDLRRRGWRASKNAIHPLEHINCFTNKTLKELGESAGLRTLDLSTMPFSDHLFGVAKDKSVNRFYTPDDIKISSSLTFYFGK